ncbi:MAG: hypothetical protein ABSD96_08135 [Candidatus Korobacteraceae bacterium]|jgi:hypothetical protein
MSEFDITIRPGIGAAEPVAKSDYGTSSFFSRVFSFPAMLGAFLVGAVFVAARAFLVDPDLWWHIKVGQNILSTHSWPTTDPYSFTVAGHPWLAYEWLGDVLLGAVARFWGLQGLEACLIVLGSAVMLALYAYTTLRTGNPKAGFAASAVLYVLAMPSFSMRPQMLGYLFLILTLIALERFRQGKSRALWFLPPLFLVWVNTHGSWVIGLGTIVVFWASGLTELHVGSIEARRWSLAERIRLESIFLLCLAVLPITPYGVRVSASPFEYAFDLPLNVANIKEWQPMPFSLPGAKLFLALLLGFFLLNMALRFGCRLHELVLFVGGAVMACLHVRFLLVFVPFFAPLFATAIERFMPAYEKRQDRHYFLNAVLMAVVLAALVRYFPTAAEMQQRVTSQYPVRAVEYLRQHPLPGPMYNTYGYGGYLIWSLPEHKVFIDGRADVYERGGAFPDYLQVANLKPAAFAVLRSYGIQSCFLERSEALATVLSASPEWRQVYSDDLSVLFVRKASESPSPS